MNATEGGIIPFLDLLAVLLLVQPRTLAALTAQGMLPTHTVLLVPCDGPQVLLSQPTPSARQIPPVALLPGFKLPQVQDFTFTLVKILAIVHVIS